MKVGIVRKLPAFPRIKAALLCAALQSAAARWRKAVPAEASAMMTRRSPARASPNARSRKKATRRKAASRPPIGKKKAELGRFDGRWSFVTTGCSGAGTIGASIRRGRFTTPISHGTISPEGAFHAVGGGRGHMESSNGSGTFRRSDGCSGSWHASRSSTRSGPK